MMTSEEPIPRLIYINMGWAKQLLGFCKQSQQELAKEMNSGSGHPGQIEYAMLGDYHSDISFLLYGLGYPLDTVRQNISQAARAYLEVFRQRGTESAIDIDVIDEVAPQNGANDPDSYQVSRPGQKGRIDYSLTNSKFGLNAIYTALSVGELSVARELAALIGDPPDATYIADDSEICTPDDQHLAYAVKGLLCGEADSVHLELRLISDQFEEKQLEANMLKEITAGNTTAFVDNLGEYLEWYKKQSLLDENERNPDFIFSINGLGLAGLALYRALLKGDDLPAGNLYLPTELLNPST